MDMTTPIVACLGCACFFAFSWAVRGHFRSTGTMPTGMKLIGTLSLLGFLSFLWHLRNGAAAWPVVVALFGTSLGVFAWAVRTTRRSPPTLAFDNDLPHILLRHGPYRYVRHPFYLSYLLFWIGTAMSAPASLAWLAPLIMGTLYRHAALREEQKFARSDLAPDYASYRKQAGMFLPRLSAVLPQ
jgi:protein-S-isoprenylcysteine O-methyltransferase Ste14